MKGLIALIVAIIVLGGGYYWYTSMQTPASSASNNDNFGMTADDSSMDAMDDTPNPTDTSNSGSSGGTNVNVNAGASVSTGTTKEFTVTGKNFSFAPAAMTVKKGDTVKITFVNSAGTHDLRVDGYNIGTKTLQGGQSETITFVADKAGSFEYYCSIGQHRQMGMKGMLTVQ